MKAALELTGPGEPPAGDDEQPDLIGGLINVPERTVEQIRRQGPGRPPGSRNKRTQEWADYLLSRYESPLEVLVQIATSRVEAICIRTGCTRFEALQEKRLAAIAALPFIHSKQPLAVDLTKTNRVLLTIVDETAPAEPGEELTLTARVIERMNGDSKS